MICQRENCKNNGYFFEWYINKNNEWNLSNKKIIILCENHINESLILEKEVLKNEKMLN